MSHFITPPSPHWPGPHPTGFHTSRSTMSNPLFCFNPPFGFFSTATTSFPLLLSSYISFMSCLYLHVCPCTLKKRSVMPLNNGWTADMTVYELKWGASSRSLHLVRFGRGGDLVWCSVWRLWLCVCVCVCIWYIFVWHRGRMFYIRFVLFTVWPYSKLCCQYAWMIEYSNSEAKFRFINTMIVSALKDLAVKAGVSLWTACVMLGSRRWSFTYCIFIHQGALSRCLKEMLKSLGAAQMLVAGSSFKKCQK